jgi:hypothetical protein
MDDTTKFAAHLQQACIATHAPHNLPSLGMKNIPCFPNIYNIIGQGRKI